VLPEIKIFAGHVVVNDLLNATIIFAVVWLLSRFVRLLFNLIQSHLISRTRTDLDNRILNAVKSPVSIGIWVLGLKWALKSIDLPNWGFREASIEGIAQNWNRVVDGLFFVLLTLVVISLITRSFDVLARWFAGRVAARTESRVDDELVPIINRLFQVLVWAVALVVVFDHFGIQVSSLLVALGAGSLAFALAAQETLANMIGGFIIFIDRPFRTGDRIELENGTRGDVQDIGLRSTKILTFENTILVVPNAQIVKEKVTNLSYPDPKIRIMVNLGVAYGSDLDRVKQIVLEVARAHPKILEEPEPKVFFLDFGASSLDLRLIARTGDYQDQWALTEEIRMGIWRALSREGISIPFPQRDLWIRNWPAGPERTERSDGPEA
jgi:MscS family membrane protein